DQLETILVTPVNFGSRRASGFDIGISYAARLSDIVPSIPGTFRVNAAAVRNIDNVIDDLVLTPVNRVGELDTPEWNYRVSAFYDLDPVSISLAARGFSDLVYSTSYIECDSGCPISTVENRTINNNDVEGAIYLHGTVSLKIPTGDWESRLSFIVNN